MTSFTMFGEVLGLLLVGVCSASIVCKWEIVGVCRRSQQPLGSHPSWFRTGPGFGWIGPPKISEVLCVGDRSGFLVDRSGMASSAKTLGRWPNSI